MHTGGINMLFAGGSVHFLEPSLSPIPGRAPATRNWSEVILADSI